MAHLPAGATGMANGLVIIAHCLVQLGAATWWTLNDDAFNCLRTQSLSFCDIKFWRRSPIFTSRRKF